MEEKMNDNLNSYGPMYDANAEGIGFFDVLKKKYAQFNGRARRKEYWMFQLIIMVIAFVAVIIMSTVMTMAGMAAASATDDPNAVAAAMAIPSIICGIVCFVFSLLILVPTLALTVRRLHDVGFSGWLVLIGFIPGGNLVLLIFMFLDSQPGNNQYGPNPKGIGR